MTAWKKCCKFWLKLANSDFLGFIVISVGKACVCVFYDHLATGVMVSASLSNFSAWTWRWCGLFTFSRHVCLDKHVMRGRFERSTKYNTRVFIFSSMRFRHQLKTVLWCLLVILITLRQDNDHFGTSFNSAFKSLLKKESSRLLCLHTSVANHCERGEPFCIGYRFWIMTK